MMLWKPETICMHSSCCLILPILFISCLSSQILLFFLALHTYAAQQLHFLFPFFHLCIHNFWAWSQKMSLQDYIWPLELWLKYLLSRIWISEQVKINYITCLSECVYLVIVASKLMSCLLSARDFPAQKASNFLHGWQSWTVFPSC